ncbi:MAG TPA: PhzF family phenazine biosynthesis protein [Vicinamibacteria bacterium]|nr:PhzF family phenazine biosynthesis protein [Vicinamibacteria bacterium]
MKIPLYHVDAFTGQLFRGNPAAVCPLKDWPNEATLQAIAAENNLSETAFFSGREGAYKIRWFTPTQEVDLCGHATLAAAFVVFNFMQTERKSVTFVSKSGRLKVTRAGELLVLDFPARPPQRCPEPPAALLKGLGRKPKEVWVSRDYLAVYDSEDEVRRLKPKMDKLAGLDKLGVIVTAPGKNQYDFVSRFFAPNAGVPEDPVTGSAHCTLVPYWALRLNKERLLAYQASARGGELYCMPRGERVAIGGRAVLYLRGAVEF